MVYEEILPHYLAIGVTWERFMDSCPKELEPYDTAHKNEIKEQDMLQHIWWGNYGISALCFAMDHCFNKNPKSEYIKKPIYEEIEVETNGYAESKEEIAVFEMKQRINLLRKSGLPESPM